MRHFFTLLAILAVTLSPLAFAQDAASEVAASSDEASPEAVGEAPVEADPAEAPAEADAPAEEVEQAVEEVVEAAEVFKAAWDQQSWALVVGLALIAVVTLLRKLGIAAKLPKGGAALPWVTLALSALASVGVALIGSMSWPEAAWGAISAAAVAMGGWDLTKLFRPKSEVVSMPLGETEE